MVKTRPTIQRINSVHLAVLLIGLRSKMRPTIAYNAPPTGTPNNRKQPIPENRTKERASEANNR